MTKTDFLLECEKVTIAPAIALENDKIISALKKRDDAEVKRLLREDF